MESDEDNDITYGSIKLMHAATPNRALMYRVPTVTTVSIHVLLHKQLTVGVIFKGKGIFTPLPPCPEFK